MFIVLKVRYSDNLQLSSMSVEMLVLWSTCLYTDWWFHVLKQIFEMDSLLRGAPSCFNALFLPLFLVSLERRLPGWSQQLQ